MYGAEPTKQTRNRMTAEVVPRLRSSHRNNIKWFRGCVHDVLYRMRRKLKLKVLREERPHMYLHTIRDVPGIDEHTSLYQNWLRVLCIGFGDKGISFDVFETEHYSVLALYGDTECLVFYCREHNIDWKLSAFYKRESDSEAKKLADYHNWIQENGYRY